MRVTGTIVNLPFKRTGALLGLVGLVGLAGCLDLKPKEACSVTVAPTSLTLPVNTTAQLVATAFDCKGNTIRNKKISFSSGTPSTATITPEGQVFAIAPGTATISAVADGKSASAQITVTPEAAANITITPGALTLRETNTRLLTAVARNAQGVVITGRTFRWNSSNSSVAFVDQTGLVTAVAAGSATITAESEQTVGGANITVTRIPVSTCQLSPANSRLTVSQSVQPVAALFDSTGAPLSLLGRQLAWNSSNVVVADVNSAGLVTTRKAGTAVITAGPTDNLAVTCTMTVEAVDPRVDKITIAPKVGSIRLGVPRSLSYTMRDSADNPIPVGREVTWTSLNPGVIQVSRSGVVTGLSIGTGKVAVRVDGAADTATFTVEKIPLKSITITPLQTVLRQGETAQLRAIVLDSTGAEVTDRPLEWITSDATRATVSSSGLVSALGAGNVTIRAVAAQDGGIEGQATVIIQQVPVDSIRITAAHGLKKGTTESVSITLLDSSGRTLLNRNVIVTSDFESIARGQANTQSTQLQITGVGEGTANLTLQVYDSNNQPQGKPSTITVTVSPP